MYRKVVEMYCYQADFHDLSPAFTEKGGGHPAQTEQKIVSPLSPSGLQVEGKSNQVQGKSNQVEEKSNQVQDSDTRLRHPNTNLDISENDLDTRLRHSGTGLDTQLGHSDTPKVSLSNKQRDIVNFCSVPRTAKEILDRIGVSMHSKNRERHITSLVAAGYLQMTNPENPTASNQKYKKVTTTKQGPLIYLDPRHKSAGPG